MTQSAPLHFETLTAAAADLERRTITGLIAPYNMPGRTSRGMLSIRPGSLTAASDVSRIKLTREHDRSNPIGYAVELETRDTGLWATFKVAATPEGDTALLEASERVRDGLSVDLVDVSMDGDWVTAGEIAAVGLCAIPAYSDARVASVAATAAGGLQGFPPVSLPQPPAVVPSAGRPPARTQRSGDDSLVAAAAAIAATARGDMTPAAMTAVLSDFTTDPASGGAALPPQWVGQLWTEADAPRPHVDAITGPRPLTSLKIQGFQWLETLKVDKYAGNKVQIPTNAPTLAPAEETAQRWAGGVDVDRAFLDLGAGDVIRDLLVQATNDYRMKTDLDCLDQLLSGTAQTAIADPVAALSNVYKVFRAARLRPSTVWMSSDVADDLSALPGPPPMYGSGSVDNANGNINGYVFEVDPDLPPATILGVAKTAATFYEKGPINVNALEIARGGIDEAVFGYTATLINRAAGIVEQPVGTPVE